METSLCPSASETDFSCKLVDDDVIALSSTAAGAEALSPATLTRLDPQNSESCQEVTVGVSWSSGDNDVTANGSESISVDGSAQNILNTGYKKSENVAVCRAGPQIRPPRSPVGSGGSGRFSLVEERSKAFMPKSSSGDSYQARTTALKPVLRYGSDGVAAQVAAFEQCSPGSSGRIPKLPPEYISKPSPGYELVDGTIVTKPCMSPSAMCQAPPPPEVVQVPPMSVPTATLTMFDEPVVLQSARVEPSPERIYGISVSQDEPLKATTVAYEEKVAPASFLETKSLSTFKTSQKSLGDNSVTSNEEHHESPGDIGTEADSKKSGHELLKGRKFQMANKPHPPTVANVRQKKPNEKEPGSSPKQQKEQKSSSAAASPPPQTLKEKAIAVTTSTQLSWKNPFKRHGSGSGLAEQGSSSVVVKGVFGVPLHLCQMSSTNRMVPLIVEICARIVEEKGLENQGIYRISGNNGAINMMVDELNKDPLVLCPDNEKWQDVNVVSSLLKQFFRKLPDSLITNDLYPLVIKANQTENSERRMLKLKKLLHELPEVNFETFQFLARHLSRVASREEANKMDARNLGILFGPSLVRPLDDYNMVCMVRDMSDQCRIVESIILHCEWFFSSWDEDVNVPVDDELDEAVPISLSNQIMLAKAESLANASSPPQHRDSHPKELLTNIIRAAKMKKGSTSSSNGKNSPSANTAMPKDEQVSETDSKPDETVPDVTFHIKKAYRFELNNLLISTENTQTQIRRTKSSESLPRPRHKLHLKEPGLPGMVTRSPVNEDVLPKEEADGSEYTDSSVSSSDMHVDYRPYQPMYTGSTNSDIGTGGSPLEDHEL